MEQVSILRTLTPTREKKRPARVMVLVLLSVVTWGQENRRPGGCLHCGLRGQQASHSCSPAGCDQWELGGQGPNCTGGGFH